MIDGDKIKTHFSKNIKVLRNKSNWGRQTKYTKNLANLFKCFLARSNTSPLYDVLYTIYIKYICVYIIHIGTI